MSLARTPFIEYASTPQTAAAQFVRPTMHRLMLNDFYRTMSFRNALISVVQTDMHVLEIGTGTGVLSYFACEAGAHHVTTLEATPFAQVAQAIVDHNGLSERITVMHGRSFDVNLPTPADLLVTETLGHMGFDEGILDIAHDARQRLLQPGAMIMPQDFRILGGPVTSAAYADTLRFWQGGHYGLRLDPVVHAANRACYLTRLRDEDLLATPAQLVHCVLGDAPQFPLRGSAKLSVHHDGEANGLGLSFVATLSPGVQLVSRSAPNWQDVFLPWQPALRLQRGDMLQVDITLARPSTQGGLVVCRGEACVAHDPQRRAIIDVGPTT